MIGNGGLLGKNGVASPLSASIKSSLSGASPTTASRAEDLMTNRAFAENVQVIDAGFCFCQSIGLMENNSVVVLNGCSMKNG